MRAAFHSRTITIATWTVGLSLCAPALAQTPTTAPSDSTTKRQAQAAEEAYLAGARYLQHSDLAGAEIQFSNATKLNPANIDYAQALAVTHQRHIADLVQQAGKARLLGQTEKANTLLAEARLLDPNDPTI